MTEPEELDEDLFADLYDADEPAPAPSVAAPVQSNPQPEIVDPVSAPDIDIPPPSDADALGTNQDSFEPTESQYNPYTNGQDDHENSRWDNDGRGSRMDVAAEQDTGGVGIKEDG
ncbi:MAG: hypothetical protein Q9220_004646 [cf. Caloplaca sp. 1 TL-2023]